MPDELQNIALLLATPVLVGNGGLGAGLVDLLLSLLEEKSSIVGAERGLYVALGLAAGTLEDRGDAQRPKKVAEIMMKQISDCRIDGASTMGVTAEALGLMCRELSSERLARRLVFVMAIGSRQENLQLPRRCLGRAR